MPPENVVCKMATILSRPQRANSPDIRPPRTSHIDVGDFKSMLFANEYDDKTVKQKSHHFDNSFSTGCILQQRLVQPCREENFDKMTIFPFRRPYSPQRAHGNNNVIMTSKRRRFDVKMTLLLRCVSAGLRCTVCQWGGICTASKSKSSLVDYRISFRVTSLSLGQS